MSLETNSEGPEGQNWELGPQAMDQPPMSNDRVDIEESSIPRHLAPFGESDLWEKVSKKLDIDIN